MHSLTAYHQRKHAEAQLELERQKTKQAHAQFAREHPVAATFGAVAVVGLLLSAWLVSRNRA